MGAKIFKIILVFAVMMSGLAAAAQDIAPIRLGTFQSPKGLGVCAEFQQDPSSFESVTFDADIFGIIIGNYSRPGYKFTYTHDMIVDSYDRGDCALELYAGPGITAGYVRDINKTYSLVAGISGVTGMRFLFERRLSVNLEIGADLAFTISKDERYGTNDLSLYKTGLLHFFYPQIRIHWAL